MSPVRLKVIDQRYTYLVIIFKAKDSPASCPQFIVLNYKVECRLMIINEYRILQLIESYCIDFNGLAHIIAKV